MGDGSEGSNTAGGTRERTVHAVQCGSSDGVTLWVKDMGCDRQNDGGDGGFPP